MEIETNRYVLFSNNDKWSATPDDQIQSFNTLETTFEKALFCHDNFMIIIDRWNPLKPIQLRGEEIQYWTIQELMEVFLFK